MRSAAALMSYRTNPSRASASASAVSTIGRARMAAASITARPIVVIITCDRPKTLERLLAEHGGVWQQGSYREVDLHGQRALEETPPRERRAWHLPRCPGGGRRLDPEYTLKVRVDAAS